MPVQGRVVLAQAWAQGLLLAAGWTLALGPVAPPLAVGDNAMQAHNIPRKTLTWTLKGDDD